MGVRSRSKRRRTAIPSAGGDADLISGLGDDVLVRILQLLPDAKDAVRTVALSRRWRDLWMRVPALHSSIPITIWVFRTAAGRAERFVTFVTDPLALRAAAQTEPAIDLLPANRPRRLLSGAGGVDMISRLGDDMLLRILELLSDARDAVRTGAVSRRWRGLWTRLPALRFASSSRPEFWGARGAKRYIAFVNDALALRSAQTEPTVEHLVISLMMTRVVATSVRAVKGWIHHAVQHATKSFVLELHLPRVYFGEGGNCEEEEEEEPVMVLNELPRSEKLETMRWALDGAMLRLPTAAVLFTSLTDLSLESIVFQTGNGHLLGRLLSSACCPHLQKLRLRKLRFRGLNESLLIEAGSLLEILLERVLGPHILQLITPNLWVLRMVEGHGYPYVLKISAPRLEELTFLVDQPIHIDVDGELPCVGSLKVELNSHADFDEHEMNEIDEHSNDGSIRLLQCCTSARCLEVALQVTKRAEQLFNIISGRIPHLPHVISLTIHVNLFELHSNGAGIEDILTQCSNLKYLRIRYSIKMIDDLEPHFLCDHLDHWKFHWISLAHLQEVEFTGLAGTDCELWFMQFVLTSAKQLQKVTISFDPKYMLKNKRDAFKLVPLLGGGMWTTCCDDTYLSYEWKVLPVSGERTCL